MCVIICGRFCPDEGAVAGYDNRIRTKYTAKWGVQIAGMIFQTRSSVFAQVRKDSEYKQTEEDNAMSNLSHLDALEAEAIYIMREVAAECEKPVMLYSIGKDSSVMLHLAMKAFYPEKPPFPFLHIDTTWKFHEMIEFRDRIAKENGIDIGCTMSLLVLLNEKYHVFHVGDSKILLIDDRVSQITKDEVSVVERDGKLKTLLANFMGKVEELWMNQSSGSLVPGETFLVGSDGLFKRLREDILFDVIRRKNVQSDTEAEDVLKYLIRNVMEMGEKDNISGVLVRIA